MIEKDQFIDSIQHESQCIIRDKVSHLNLKLLDMLCQPILVKVVYAVSSVLVI
jgi:hypothetical protein